MTVIYDKVAVIGMGLIGASIALAARRGELATTIIGSDQSPEVAAVVARLQLVDSFEADAVHAVADADLVILAVPEGAGRCRRGPEGAGMGAGAEHWY